MSWFTSLFGGLLRAIGINRPRDRKIPPPLPGSDLLKLSGNDHERSREAIAVLRGYVRAPYQITDREFFVGTVSWDEGRAFFARYGYDAKNWTKTREGNFYPPKPGILTMGLIQLVDKDLDQPRRVFLALHEASHACWHWLLLPSEWDEWNMRNWSYEEFADDLARRFLGEKLSKDKTRFFEKLEARLLKDGAKSVRL